MIGHVMCHDEVMPSWGSVERSWRKKRWGFESAKVEREFSKNIRYWDGNSCTIIRMFRIPSLSLEETLIKECPSCSNKDRIRRTENIRLIKYQ